MQDSFVVTTNDESYYINLKTNTVVDFMDIYGV